MLRLCLQTRMLSFQLYSLAIEVLCRIHKNKKLDEVEYRCDTFNNEVHHGGDGIRAHNPLNLQDCDSGMSSRRDASYGRSAGASGSRPFPGGGGGGGGGGLSEFLVDQEAADDAKLLQTLARGKSGGGTGGGVGIGARGTSTTSALAKRGGTQRGAANAAERNVYDYLPQDFLLNPRSAAPELYFLPKLLASRGEDADSCTLQELLDAADDDVRLHRARIQAGLDSKMQEDPNPSFRLRTYQLEQDPVVQQRNERLQQWKTTQQEVTGKAETILKELQETAEARGMTVSERTQVQVERWQRALELYVYNSNPDLSATEGKDAATVSTATTIATTTSGTPALAALDWQSLFDKLLVGISEDQDIELLSSASWMCRDLVERSQQQLIDTAMSVQTVEHSYQIRLEAHLQFVRGSLNQVVDLQDSFLSSGRAALQIGHQLEHAELKRSQCEAASILIRRWWNLESLASDESIKVEDEIGGVIPPTACKMDPLYTMPEHSLDASQALKSLRAVVRSRGTAVTGAAAAAAAATVGGDGGAPVVSLDKESTRRFQLTSVLIARTSDALEQRLLQSFSTVYTAGGTYDFSNKPRPGSIDWRELRYLAKALLLFDSGRNLHKRYVDMVVSSRFPELFQAKSKESRDAGEETKRPEDFDIDETRSNLSALFRKVSDVCTAEFELIAHVFGTEGNRTNLLDGSEEMALVVARSLLQRVISDPKHGLQSRINDLLVSIDRSGTFEAGAKKLDTFVVIHEKAAGLFSLLEDAAEAMVPEEDPSDPSSHRAVLAARNAVESLKGFLTSQELALSNSHRQGYINLELRLLHHDCCSSLDQAGCTLVKGPSPRPNTSLAEKGILEEYRAPVLPLHKESLARSGFPGILAGPLKQSVLRQPLIHATDSLSRARLMFGTSERGGETTARVILGIYSQMCSFYGQGFLYPVVESLREMLPASPPSQPPQLPFDEEQEAPDLGVPPAFWVALERVHSASKSFDRELWAENRPDSHRVWETLDACGDPASLAIARDERQHFYAELERRGEAAILQALDTLSAHIQWVLVAGESMLATGGTRILSALSGQSGGPYAVPAGSSLETPNSPAVKSVTYCLRVQFVHVQAALTSQSLASLWTALSMRLYDILVARLLQYYYVSTVGAVILSRDVEALRSAAMLAGTDHTHWDTLRELLTLYMTPPDAIKAMLTGPDGDPGKGLFAKAGRDKCLVFMSRRNDYRYKTAAGLKKSGWVTDLLSDLNVADPTDGHVNIGTFAAGRNA